MADREGVELSRPCGRWISNPVRLPFRHLSVNLVVGGGLGPPRCAYLALSLGYKASLHARATDNMAVSTGFEPVKFPVTGERRRPGWATRP